VAKIAVGYAIGCNVRASELHAIIRYCLLGAQEEYVAHLCEPLTKALDTRRFNHTIVLSGSPSTGLLVAFIELFGCAPFLVALSHNYNGEDLLSSYAIDPTSGEELQSSAKVNLDRDSFKRLFVTGEDVPNGFIECYKTGLANAQAHQQLMREISDAVDGAFQLLRAKGFDGLTQENYPVFAKYIEENFFLPKVVGRHRGSDAEGDKKEPACQ
jgi:hypothetical protein